ncbi:ATP-dependent helicase Lhr and Lhr-like helicase [Rhodococcoides kroppenstedtii]|uniref:ATP-dependent helicase Lhr and Lhr-like helicase n=1 Tax=Rhodococcoides kroppenstedtii TaxID=293050 RepID=A0A1I0TXK0_9NOCA|nr:DEAD/DEAH box helicase [Rhodococcus kroppenstedtii]SFA56390.1 ATP-dependent helicase Lhr and Lhr-like helicase [Rhodococcus kroppenstedtii]
MSGFDLLDPVIQHHVVNSLGWQELRPLQDSAVRPVLDGEDAILLAPTAGGKTEAALFPLLSRMSAQRWQGLSVLYLCPLKALLNNLQPRVATYSAWTGHTAATWHGDVTAAKRAAIMRDRPDVLLTTPESLESILVSRSVDAEQLFGNLQAVVIDEVHAFAGDDRGWHLLAVLARIESLLGRPLQRIGMSATVGNPTELLQWLQSADTTRVGSVIAPEVPTNAIAAMETSLVVREGSILPALASVDVTVDYVGSVENAVKVIAALHHGEKRLVFVDSRRLAEELGEGLHDAGITVFLSHSSLSATERRRSEEAFADARDCVIVATSTLELGIDVGDLDRVIQINAPRTVSSFLQRLGRTGRRPGTSRNCLFLALDSSNLVSVLGMLMCWSAGWVEPVTPPVAPRHIAAQQVLAYALQHHKIPLTDWKKPWGTLPLFDSTAQQAFDYLLEEKFLERDGGIAFIGPAAEQRFGRRHFMDLLAVFTAAPQFTVMAGRNDIGFVETEVLTESVEGPRVLLLGGRSWLVTHIDWKRRLCYVESTTVTGRAKWGSAGEGASFPIARGMRAVILGAAPAGVTLTRRARDDIEGTRADRNVAVSSDALVITRDGGDWRWWTWAGSRANRTLSAWLPDLVPPRQSARSDYIRLHSDLDPRQISDALAAARRPDAPKPLPFVDPKAVRGLKFSAALPDKLAALTLSSRLLDSESANMVLTDPVQIHSVH